MLCGVCVVVTGWCAFVPLLILTRGLPVVRGFALGVVQLALSSSIALALHDVAVPTLELWLGAALLGAGFDRLLFRVRGGTLVFAIGFAIVEVLSTNLGIHGLLASTQTHHIALAPLIVTVGPLVAFLMAWTQSIAAGLAVLGEPFEGHVDVQMRWESRLRWQGGFCACALFVLHVVGMALWLWRRT